MRSILMCLVLALTGCVTSLMSQTPITREVQLVGTPQAVFAHTTTTLKAMGGEVRVHDTQGRVLVGVLHGAVSITAQVDEASIVHVSGSLLPNKLVIGQLTEVDDFAVRLAQKGLQ